jgi:hypothetical protein
MVMLVLFGGLVPVVGKKISHLGHPKESLRTLLRKGKKRYPSTETGDETHTMDAEGND